MNPDERTQKRLWGIARHWQRQFGLNYDMLEDILSMAWVAWYERPTVSAERRFHQVFNQVRRDCIAEIWGVCPHAGKIPEVKPLYRGVVTQVYEPDFIGRVRIREITDACRRDTVGLGKGNSSHITTLRILAGLDTKKRPRHTVKERVGRLRKLLKTNGLAA
jgi:hypothetical protein